MLGPCKTIDKIYPYLNNTKKIWDMGDFIQKNMGASIIHNWTQVPGCQLLELLGYISKTKKRKSPSKVE